MSKKKLGECYLCGVYEQLTDDHVPPKVFFPKPIGNLNLITVGACRKCNNAWGNKETKLAHDLSIVGSTQDARKVFTQSTRQNYMRGFWERGGLPSKDYFDIISRTKRTYLKDKGVIVSPSPVTLFNIPKDRDEVLIKIAKGLHKHHKGKRLPSDIDSFVQIDLPIINKEFMSFSKFLTVKRDFGETFFYGGGFANDEEETSFWYLCFYRNITFLVTFFPKGYKEKRSKRKKV